MKSGLRERISSSVRPAEMSQPSACTPVGERMPRKSTYFYPKPVSGLVFYPMDPGFHGGGEGGSGAGDRVSVLAIARHRSILKGL